MSSIYNVAAIVVVIWCITAPSTTRINEEMVSFVGCFKDDPATHDLPYAVNLSHGFNYQLCISSCKNRFFRFAGIQNNELCFCGGTHGRYGPGTCEIPCPDEANTTCGGTFSNSIFDTGQRTPSPPASLKLVNATETSVHVIWEPPLSANEVLRSYTIVANKMRTFSTSGLFSPRQELSTPPEVLKTDLLNLHPGTEYAVSVHANTEYGPGEAINKTIWTLIGEPTEPEAPIIKKRDEGTIVIKINEAENENGPVTAYRIVVVINEGHTTFRPQLLKSYEDAAKEGLNFYIAAEIKSKDFRDEFVVGDGRRYGEYYNPPLPPDADVHVTVGTVSSFQGVTRVKYANVGHEQHDIVILDVGDGGQGSSAANSDIVIGLTVAIGVSGFLLLLSIITYCLLRRYLGHRRRGSDHQELSLQGPMIEVEPSGYIHNGYVPEEEDERVNHYDRLKQQVWSIPRNFLDVRSESLGAGQYGNVMRGTVQQRGYPVPAAVHVIQDRELETEKKRVMLRDLNVLIRIGNHTNFTTLIGTCECPDTLFVVVEHHPASLKDVLLESRCLEHMNAGQRNPQRFCSLAETQVLEAVLGIARAMDYLSTKKIVHTQLAARNVLMADGIIPKVAGCGISQYNKHNDNPDYTRWTAHEIFRGRTHVSKSDVWSFGCLLWEVTALGGTPYADVPTVEVASRVMRGLRLHQLHFVDDDLYQLMIQCWQMDLDERPTFQEIVHIVENMLEDSTVHLNFEMYTGFHYEQYNCELEQRQDFSANQYT